MPDLTLTSHGGSFDADLTVPGDKSLSHRALLFAGMAEGDSLVEGLTSEAIGEAAALYFNLDNYVEVQLVPEGDAEPEAVSLLP